MSYAELHCLSNFTFLRGASHPEELVRQANELAYAGIALTDECSLAGVVRAHAVAAQLQIRFVVGSEFRSAEGLNFVVLAPNRAAYAALCSLITRSRRSAPKGQYSTDKTAIDDCLADSECLVLWLPGLDGQAGRAAAYGYEFGSWLYERFAGSLWLGVEHLIGGSAEKVYRRCSALAKHFGIPMLASGNVHMHTRRRRMLQDTLTAIRTGRPLRRAGFALYPNGERYLRPLPELRKLYPQALLDETLAVLERVEFSLDELRYEYPRELVPAGVSPGAHLRRLTEHGMQQRWPDGVPVKVERLIEHELALIAELGYEPYFLTVHDIVRFARSRGILCQGRGSAANSAVCYCLQVTEVDPSRMEMLFERFISKERNEPPDIDVDFEHERREEVIQYIYEKYTRDRAALAATVITYRPRSAIRDVGKALGLSELQLSALAKSLQWWEGRDVAEERLREAGFAPQARVVRQLLYLTNEILGFPRHLSQHVGGFIISASQLSELVPIENAAMPDRTVIQWDKEDLESLGLLKIDVLGLGMLSAIRRSFELLEAFYSRSYALSDIVADDAEVYAMISRADTIGVFQIESRAQMAMLPRLKPQCYYDLVIEVAIIRPGPIQGDMVHPYLRRRNGEEAVSYPSEAVRGVLERTLGVPIFQEQVMQLAIVAAGFTPGEADGLRRAMAAWGRRGDLGFYRERLIGGMRERGYSEQFAEQIFNQIKGFGEYGFPESHSASFALLAYASAWLKCHEPAAFFCALLNSQPMGFYAPAQLVAAARAQQVEVRPVDVTRSERDCSLERDTRGMPCIRLGLRMIKGLSAGGAQRLIEARRQREFAGVDDLARRAAVNAKDLGCLASAGALKRFASNRYQARWQVAGIDAESSLEMTHTEAVPLLGTPGEGQDIVADYRHIGLTLGRHPLAVLRGRLQAMHIATAEEVRAVSHGRFVRAAGLVVTRQRPASAAGVTFVTLEDETGYLNLIVWENVANRERRALLNASLMGVEGQVQKQGEVLHIVARRLHDHSALLGNLTVRSRNFQ
ncbi:MAG TPA: error-prone DNA polymerase [Gammaproteobacteria bacterium]|nr:error-prone DNA polymerase [Gammaproteobacteria bacterium]